MTTNFWKWMVLGSRKGLGDGNRVLLLASKAALRKRSNWALPGLLALTFIVAVITLNLLPVSESGFSHVFFRIVVFDYLIFVLGWMCGWALASRWRKDQHFVEELVTTDLRPSVLGNLLFAGALAVWLVLLIVICLFDLLFSTIAPERYTTYAIYDPVALLSILLMAAFYVLLVFFHLETLRIAYWMFASAALPRIKLFNQAVSNFFLIPVYVFGLTIFGSMITGLSWLLILTFAAIIGIVSDEFATQLAPARGGQTWSMVAAVGTPMDRHVFWALASIPGMLVVMIFKRLISKSYEKSFWKNYLLFSWYGAAEHEQPKKYPLAMQQRAMEWVAFLSWEESQIRKGEGTEEPRPANQPSQVEMPATTQDSHSNSMEEVAVAKQENRNSGKENFSLDRERQEKKEK